MKKVWVIHELEISRYDEIVKFHGVATSEEERDRIFKINPRATVTEIEPNRDLTQYGAQHKHEDPNW